jgi:hypothetical protein
VTTYSVLHRRRRSTVRAPRVTFGQCFDVEIARDAGGWQIRIPEIGAVTHARRRDAIEGAARECIAVRTGIPIGYIGVITTESA